MAEKKDEKPEIIKFVKPEMDLYVADEEEMPGKPEYKIAGRKSKWKSVKETSGGKTVCTCNQVCTCNLVRSHRSRRGGGGGSRRVCTCVPVAH